MLRIRNAVTSDANALARVMIDATIDAFRGRVPDQCLQWITPEESSRNWQRTIECDLRAGDRLLVADHGPRTELAALALVRGDQANHDIDHRGELRVIAVTPDFQRQGLGHRLVSEVATHLNTIGVNSMLVHIYAANPNSAFYERLGARLLREERCDWNGVVLPQCVYGWDDLKPMLDATKQNAPASRDAGASG